ncbi:hypothetical protein [Flavobacterium sp.]|uniref:hypothetical protein n=1 Tax=Flavobacterium sp. TaxID=239 RepID=UPI0025C55261|nr:hypothetical protein [Flavobacterium sp.]|tara:strand:- start:895 stop:1512 length:618 start_codon:yes stop_codon:yes gene_type:complete
MHFKLTEEIISLSDSRTWDFAKLEWDFEFAYYSEELQTCLCGHFPIKNICVIRNKRNSNQTEVGNCCINKFLGIEDGNKIFTSIKKIKEDNSKSMSAVVIDYIYSKNGISEFEYNFYVDIHRKRNLSFKQLEIKKRINNKFLAFTSYETNSHFNRIKLVLKWAENNSWFDKSFVLSLKKSCERNGKLTENQRLGLENIITKLKIE